MAEKQSTNQFKNKRGLERIIAALSHSANGMREAYRHEEAFRQEVILAAVGCVVALFLPVTLFERFLLIGVLVLVLVVELLNSAIEAVVDRISFELHPLSKNAKDYGSAAVLLMLMLAMAAWGMVLWRLWCR